MHEPFNDYMSVAAAPALNKWILREDVKSPCTCTRDSLFFDGDNGEGMVYKQTEPDLMPFYRKVAEDFTESTRAREDADPSINSFVAENWT